MGRPRKRNRVDEQGQTGSEHRVAENAQAALDLGNRLVPGARGYSVPAAGERSSGKGRRLRLGPILLLSAMCPWAASLSLSPPLFD